MRADLSHGQQAVQAAHALQEFNMRYQAIASEWHASSNTLAMLSVPDEAALGVVLDKADDRGIPAVAFHEPDLNNQMTAIAIGPEGRQVTKNLSLAFR